MSIKFGTEGWRAVMADGFTFANVRIVTQAIAETLKGKRPNRLVVGHDTRFLSAEFARAVAEVLAGNGFQVVVSKTSVPTCAVSRYVLAKHLPTGIMVTASHNPPTYNGIKVKAAYGGSATSDAVAAIERRIGNTPPKHSDRGITQDDLMGWYLGGLRKFINLPAIRRWGGRVVVDSMHGTGGRIIEQLVKGGRCRVRTLRGEPDAWFGGQAPEPIASHLGPLLSALKRGADVGIANDGDADRIGVIAPGGRWLNPGQVMCVLATHLVKSRQASGAVVKTVSNTMMIDRMTEALGLRLLEVPVGFKHVAKLMLEDDILIGGEESGGIGVKGYMPERDGILNGLLVLEAMAVQRTSLTALMADLERRYGRWAYGRQDLRLSLPQVEALFARLQRRGPSHLAGVPVARVNMLDGFKFIGRDDSWLLYRRSGTEPIVRIYAETPRPARLPALLAQGVRVAKA